MIQITDKANCVGCGSCIKVCPTGCLHASFDSDGLLYPEGTADLCIKCNKCHSICPVENKLPKSHFPKFIAARNCNDIVRMNSSSGGVFYELAKNILGINGVVYGAAYNGTEVEHIAIQSITELHKLQKSKYVQSSMSNVSFHDIKRLCKPVLFSGTPCQIKALYLALDADSREKTLFVEVACHGVPKTKIYREFIHKNNIKSIDFRSKNNGISKNEIVMEHTDGSISRELSTKNKFYCDYIECRNLRPSCFKCPAKNFSSGADITLGDYWGIEQFSPDMFDDKGASVIIIHTKKGEDCWQKIKGNFDSRRISKIAAIKCNPCIIRSVFTKLSFSERFDNYLWTFRAISAKILKLLKSDSL